MSKIPDLSWWSQESKEVQVQSKQSSFVRTENNESSWGPLTDLLYTFYVVLETQYIIYLIIFYLFVSIKLDYLCVEPMVLGGKYSLSLGLDV